MRSIVLAAILMGMAPTAQAQQVLPTPEQIQAAAQAIKSLQAARAPAAPSLAAPSAGPEASAPALMGVATLANPSASDGWAYFDSWYCGAAASAAGAVYYMVFTDSSVIWSVDPGEAAMFASACGARSSVAVHVTSVNGSTFGWDEANFAPR